jgi:hypothetical protein
VVVLVVGVETEEVEEEEEEEEEDEEEVASFALFLCYIVAGPPALQFFQLVFQLYSSWSASFVGLPALCVS